MSSEFSCSYCSACPRNPCYSGEEARDCPNASEMTKQLYAPETEQRLRQEFKESLDELSILICDYIELPSEETQIAIFNKLNLMENI